MTTRCNGTRLPPSSSPGNPHPPFIPIHFVYHSTNTNLDHRHETTARTMSWVILELSRHPEMQTRLQAEVDSAVEKAGGLARMTFADFYHLNYVANCINEALRLWPVVPNGQWRKMDEDMAICGVLIPKGTTVVFPQLHVHHDKAIWGQDADRYNPGRKWHHEAFFPFGVSPRDCLGRNIAMLEMRVALVSLFHLFTSRLAFPDAPVEEFAGATMFPKNGVHIFLEKRIH